MKLTRAYLFPICLIYSFLVLFLASCVSPVLALAMSGVDAPALISALIAGLLGVSTIAGSIFGMLVIYNIIEIDLAIKNVIIVAILIGLLAEYLGYKSLSKAYEYIRLRMIVVNFAATGGTSYRNADLTNANFTGAKLTATDFRGANLTQTCFYTSSGLHQSRQENPLYSALSNPPIRNLIIDGNGRNKSYVGANLRGLYLVDANFEGANLTGANLSEANLEGASLENANLKEVQATGTNFAKAKLTGACLEKWNIDSTTQLDNLDCRFVYLLEHPKLGTDDRERRPSSGEFKPGEFTKLFEEVLNTVDLIFRDGIDWKAFVTAFKKVQVENEGTELAIQSIENKGDGVVVVKVAVPVDANKEKIHSDFNQNYQIALQAIEEKYKAHLQAKDEQIVIYRQQSAEMKEIISLLANKPVNIYNTQENQNMTNSNDSSHKIEIGTVGRDFNAIGQALNLGEIDISGTVTNIINQLPDSPEPEKPGIKELLQQLQEAIKAETNLSEEDKNEALEQLKTLAKAGQNPQEGTLQKAAKTAIKILKGTISSLPSAATLVETCSKILPLLSQYLGLG